jgi:hypothetical protein
MKITFIYLLRISAVLWVLWGLVHLFAGIMTITQNTPGAISGIADAVDPETLQMDYPAAAGAVIKQHGWNLGWVGLVTMVGGVFIWRGSITSIWVTGLIGGLTDLGYFIYLDIPGYVHFVPGTVMTLISSAAIILSFRVWLSKSRAV